MANASQTQANVNRNFALDRGGQLMTDIGVQAGSYGQPYGTNYNNTATALENLNAQPGFTPQEQEQISQTDATGKLLGVDYNANYLNPDVQSSISGDPYKQMEAYNPGQMQDTINSGSANINQVTGATANQLGTNVTNTNAAMQGAIDPNALAASSQYGKSMGTALGGAQTGVGKTLGTEASSVNSAIDPSKLSITPEQQQAMVTAAGTTVGNQYRQQQAQIAQKALEQGNTSPAALAAMQERSNIESGSASGDAMTNARIAAANAALGAEQYQTGAKVGAAEQQGALGTSAAENLGQMGLTAAQQQEATRLGAQQYVTNANLGVAQNTGAMGAQAGQFEGQQQLNAQQGLLQSGLGAEQYQQTSGMAGLAAGENAASNRALALGTNQQTTNETNQANQFNRGMTVAQQQSSAAQAGANARIAGQNTYLGGVTGQEAQAQQGALTSQGQQVSALGATTGAANQATNTGIQASQIPSTFDKVVGAGIGLAGAVSKFPAAAKLQAGGIATKPGVYNIGDHGDEAVVSLDGHGSSVVKKPTMAVLGNNGPEMVVPFNRGRDTKVSTNAMVGGPIKSRSQHPNGPTGPRGPLRSLESLKPLSAYR